MYGLQLDLHLPNLCTRSLIRSIVFGHRRSIWFAAFEAKHSHSRNNAVTAPSRPRNFDPLAEPPMAACCRDWPTAKPDQRWGKTSMKTRYFALGAILASRHLSDGGRTCRNSRGPMP